MRYNAIREALHGEPQSSGAHTNNVIPYGPDRRLLKTAFGFLDELTITTTSLKRKLKELQRFIYPDKTLRDPPRVKHLCELLHTALVQLVNAWEGNEIGRGSDDPQTPPPDPQKYHRYNSSEFAQAAGETDENGHDSEDSIPRPPPHSPPDENENGIATEDPRGRDGPINADGSPTGDALTGDWDCVSAYPLEDYAVSPFWTVTWIPDSCREHWAIAYEKITSTLINAISLPQGADRTRRLGTTARWYLGAPQIFLRSNGR